MLNFTESQIQRFWANVPKGDADTCWLWTGSRMRTGYGALWLARGRQVYAHRMMLMLETGADIPPSLSVCHRCDNPPCVNPAHLFVGTNTDNVRDSVRKHRDGRRRKLTDQQVDEIRRARASGERLLALANRYGVTETTISYIARRLQWNVR